MKKILLVDDNNESLYLLQSILNNEGIESAQATNGAIALEKLKEESFDLIISDILMPVMDGFGFCYQCKQDEKLKNIPFVFHTATYTDYDDEDLAMKLGAALFIRKPADADDLINQIKNLISKKQTALAGNGIEIENDKLLVLYNERLIQKLEKKNIELELEIKEKKKAKLLIEKQAQDLKELTAHIQDIRETERKLISRELHDELGQLLTSFFIDLKWLQKNIPELNEEVSERISDMIQINSTALTTIRQISSRLRPSILDDLGLHDAIDWQLKDFEKRTTIKTHFNSDINDMKIPESIALNLFRILQESLTNIIRHSKATQVDTFLSFENGILCLTIADNGIGINLLNETARKSLGLLGMRERIEIDGGNISINSEENKGVTITASVPFELINA